MSAKQYTFWSYNKSVFYIVLFDGNPFMPFRKGKQKDLRISNFTLLLAVFKSNHGSKRVNISHARQVCFVCLFFKPRMVFNLNSDDFDIWHLRTLFCGRMESEWRCLQWLGEKKKIHGCLSESEIESKITIHPFMTHTLHTQKEGKKSCLSNGKLLTITRCEHSV